MARRRKKREEVQSYNYSKRESNGSVGLSKAALEALNSGTYGKMTSRKPSYTKSDDQNISQRRVPFLEGMSRSASFSSRPKKQNETKPVRQGKRSDVRQERKSLIDTDRARRNYAAKLSAPSMEFTKETKAAQTPTPKKKETAAPVLTTSQKQIVNALEKSLNEEPKEEKGINIERARRNYAKNATKPSSRYENKNIRTDLGVKETDRDKSYDKDFDEFYEWRYNKLGVMPDYDPATDTNVEHWEQVKKDIMAKHGWSEKDFDEKWKAYDKERTQKMADEEIKSAVELAKAHPALGTAVQAAYTPQTWLEGLATGIEGAAAGLGKLTGKNVLEGIMPTSSDDVQFTGTRLKEGVKQEVRDNHIKSDLGRQAYEAGTGLLDMVESMAVPGGAAWMGATKGANRQMQSLERGVDPEKAAMAGALSGANSAVMNKVGLDWALGSGGRTLLGTLGKAANREGLENVAEDLVDMGIDKLINGDESELDALHDYYVQNGGDENVWLKVVGDKLKELGTSYISGGVMGGAFGAAKNLPALQDFIANKWSENNLGAISNDPNIRAILADAMEPVDYSADELSEINKYAADRAAIREEMSKNVNPTDLVAMTKLNELRAEGKAMDAEMQEKYPELFDDRGKFIGVPEQVEAAPEAPAEEIPADVNPDDVIYHAGTLSRLNKAETRGKMHEGSRNTGYYGTGHYFVDGAHRGEIGKGSSYADRPYSSVDISNYDNLYRADTDAKASKLHNFSEKFTRYVNGFNIKKYLTDPDGNIDVKEQAEYLDDLYKDFRNLFPEQGTSKQDFINQLEDYRASEEGVDLSNRDDSVFTQFMKSMGYNGVDARGTRSADTSRGIVIYDLDEDSVLQSNVTDPDAKNGLMNTRVRNEGQGVFDEAEDAKIREELDAYKKRKDIESEYNRIYDETALDDATAEVQRLEDQIKNIENNEIPEYERRLNDEEYLEAEVARQVKDFNNYGLEATPEEVRAIMLENARENLADETNKLSDLREQLEAAKAIVGEEEAKSQQAMKQATDKINGEKWVTLDDIKSEEEPYEDTADVKPTIEAVKPVMRKGEGLQGEELTKAQEQVKKNKSDIKALQNEIDILTKDKSNYWRGQLKKDVQESIKGREKTIKKLKSENTELNRSIKGKEVPIRQQLAPELYDEIYGRGNSFAGDIYAALKLAGDTKEAKQYAADAKQALANYINTGEMQPHLRQFAENLNALGRLARDSGNTYGEAGNYEGWFGKNNLWDYELDRNYLDGIRQFHAERNAANAPTETPEVPTEAAASAPVEEAPRAEIPENPVNGGGNVPPERPLITEPVESDDIGKSAVIGNSARHAGIVDDYEYENDPVIKGITEYAKHHNEQTYESALNEVRTNGSKLLEEYNSDQRIIDNDKDVDQAMLLLRNLKEQIKGKSPEEVGDLITQKNMLLSRLRKAGTKYGQAIQAFAKWNDTPEGALINGERILKDRVDAELTRNTKVKDATDKAGEALANIVNEPTENYRIRNDGKYQLKKEGDPNEATSKYLDKALRQQGYDGTMEPEPKAPKSHEQHRIEVENSIRRELGSVADRFTDNDFEYLTNLVENKVPIDTIIDEIEHKLNHGEWYTIDESTPIKKETSSKLTKILKNMGNDARKAKNNVPEVGDITYPAKSHATIAKEVGNTLENDPAAVELNNPDDVDFITTMIEDGVPDWQIEDEISHRLLHGEWYELDKSVEQPKPENSKLRAALNALVDEGEKPAKVELTRDEIREQVRNTLDKEVASMGTSRLYTDQGEWTDEDVDYITNLIQNGATKEELTDALRTKLLTGTFSISADTQTKVNRLFEYADKFDPNSKEACEARAAAYGLIAEETCGKATGFEKFETWRYLAMLGNPKTMMRNTVGNGLFNAVTSTSNAFSAVLEGATDKAVKGSKKGINKLFGTNLDTSKGIQRRKALLNPVKDGSLIKAAHADADAKRYKQIKGSKYEKGSVKDKIKAEKSVFDNKLIRLYERATDAGISDYQFVKAKYATSLAGYMKANGMSESAFDAEPRYKELQAESKQRVLTDAERSEMDSLKQTMDDLDKARDYALKQAEYATFHEENAVAKWISDASRNAPKAGKWLIEGTVPFKKTPANIVRSGFEYSPLGAIKSVAETGKLIYENTGSRKNYADTYITKGGKEKTKTLVADVLDSWSKTLTGTGLAALGYFLHNRGILNSSTNDEKYQDELEGKQNYSITVNGHTVTLDWAAPAVMPLLMGAEMSKIKQKNNLLDKKIYENFDEVISTVNAILDPMIETSMMQGIKNTLEDAANEVRYNDDAASKIGGMGGALLTGAATNYLTQVVPTLSGQLARTVDPVRRSTDTFSGGADNSAIEPFEKQGRRLMNKIPFLSTLNEPYRDAYGRTQKNSPTDSGLGSLLYQSVSPAYVDKIDVTDADKSARGAYMGYDESVPEEDRKPIMDKGVFATWKGKVTVDGHKLDPKEMSVYREKSGNAQYDIRDALAKEEWFNNLDGAKQTDILKKVNTLVDKIGKEAAGYPQSGDDINAFNSGKVPNVLDYLKTKSQSKAITDAGLSSSSKEAKAIKEAYAEGDEAKANKLLEQAQKDQAPAQELDMSTDHYQKVMNVAKDKSDRVKQDIPKLRGMGMPESSDYVYANAVNKEPNITIDTFVKQYKEMDTNKADKLTQKEMLEHFNKKRLPEAEVMRLWTVYQQGDWKRVPYLKEDGTWGVHDAK